MLPNIGYGEAAIDTAKLSLSAQATLSKPANELQLSIGIVTLSDTAETALAENSSSMQNIIDALHKTGLNEADYKTGRFSIHPTYTPYPKDPPHNWKPSINGYEVSNSLLIKTEKLDLAGKLIDAASKAGANSVENITFNLHDPRAHWDEVISLATQHAISDAQIIANAAKVQLGRLLSITLDSTGNATPRFNNVYFTKSAPNAALPPIEAGDIEITASISVSYEIKQ
jgi:uncharacterized protein YggE